MNPTLTTTSLLLVQVLYVLEAPLSFIDSNLFLSTHHDCFLKVKRDAILPAASVRASGPRLVPFWLLSTVARLRCLFDSAFLTALELISTVVLSLSLTDQFGLTVYACLYRLQGPLSSRSCIPSGFATQVQERAWLSVVYGPLYSLLGAIL